jgi:hypothetical protein
MRIRVIVVTLAISAALAACEAEQRSEHEQSRRAREEKRRQDPVAGVADNLQGIQRGSEDGFGRAADSMR